MFENLWTGWILGLTQQGSSYFLGEDLHTHNRVEQNVTKREIQNKFQAISGEFCKEVSLRNLIWET